MLSSFVFVVLCGLKCVVCSYLVYMYMVLLLCCVCGSSLMFGLCVCVVCIVVMLCGVVCVVVGVLVVYY